MLTKSSQELDTFQCHYFLPVIPVITIAKENTIFINGQKPVIVYRHSMSVPAKVIDNLFRSCKGLFGIYNPGGLIQIAYERIILR
jgi:hypothetical protein